MYILRLLVSVKNAFIPPSWIRKTDSEPLCTVMVFSFAPKRMSCTRSVRLSYLSNVNICQVYDDLTERIELSARNYFPVVRDAAVESQLRRLAERLWKSHTSRTYFVTSYVEWGHSFLLNGTICLREGRTKEVPSIFEKEFTLKRVVFGVIPRGAYL